MIVVGNSCDNRWMIFYDVVIVQEKMLRENLNTATRSEQMMTNTGTEHSVSSDTPSLPLKFLIVLLTD